MKKTYLLLFVFGLFTISYSLEAQEVDTSDAGVQLVDSLNSRIAALKSQISTLNVELKATEALIPPTYGWKKAYTTTLGFSSTTLNNWQLNPNPNSTTSTIMASMSGSLNKIEKKYFWRNSGILSMGWQKLQIDKDEPEGSEFQPTVDVFQITSLYGRNITKNLALSALGELRTTIIENAFNPGYIDLGAGLTWTPIPNLVAVFHPLNYNIVIAEEALMYESSLGTKFVVDYAQEVIKGVKFRSNLSGFASYSEFNELSNISWISGISFTAFKGIGVGLEYALRWAPQETQMVDSNTQSYFLIGLNYSL